MGKLKRRAKTTPIANTKGDFGKWVSWKAEPDLDDGYVKPAKRMPRCKTVMRCW